MGNDTFIYDRIPYQYIPIWYKDVTEMTIHIHLDGTPGIDIREVGLGSTYYTMEQSDHKIIIKRADIQKLIDGLKEVLADYSA